MAKIYGGRWQIVAGSQIGHGGQSEVFRVVDTSGEMEGEFALKRILNPKRHARFLNEIAAIKRLQHPNIIKLIDHSVLDMIEGNDQKQYLVMPIAKAGDLGDDGRVELYKDSIDSTLNVAKQLASALAASHAANIIHRDVKPQNILFTGQGHETWLTDFGICLVRDTERPTETGEVVGPRSFMAPELEGGGQLDVTPAADIYSLGKVIYFMLTGGTELPRERLHEDQFKRLIPEGERFRMLNILLGEMICLLPSRIKEMPEILRRLEAIEEWEHKAQLVPVSPTGLAAIDRLKTMAQETRRITDENILVRTLEEQRLDIIRKSFCEWLRIELEKAANLIQTTDLRAAVRIIDSAEIASVNIPILQRSRYEALDGFELVIEEVTKSGVQHVLQILLCEKRTVTVTVNVIFNGVTAQNSTPTVRPVKDHELALVPCYRKESKNYSGTNFRSVGYLTRKDLIGRTMQITNLLSPGRANPQVRPLNLRRITSTFSHQYSQHVEFKDSEWATANDTLRNGVVDAIDAFVEFVASGDTIH